MERRDKYSVHYVTFSKERAKTQFTPRLSPVGQQTLLCTDFIRLTLKWDGTVASWMRAATLPGFHAQMKHSKDPSQHKGENVPDVKLLGEWQGAGPGAGISLLSRAKIHGEQPPKSSKAKAIFVSFSSYQEKVRDQTAHVSCIYRNSLW